MIRFEVDRKLDNNRVPLYNFSLISLKYKHGQDDSIIREKIKYKSHSGYCLDAVQKPNTSGEHTVSINDIGRVQHRGTIWEIYCYEDLEAEGMELIKNELVKFKNMEILRFINSMTMLPI